MSTESTTRAPLRLLLVDGHAGFLQAALQTVSNDERIGWVASAQSGREALAYATTWSPDLVIMEITLPDGNGFEVGQSMKTMSHVVCVVLMTVYETEAYCHAAMSAGLDGVIDKGDFGAQVRVFVDRLCTA